MSDISEKPGTSLEKTPLEKTPASVKFERLPMVDGPLTHFNQYRSETLKSVIHRTLGEISPEQADVLLEESMYLERVRLHRASKLSPSYFFTYKRRKNDQQIWRMVRGELRKTKAEVDRHKILDQVLSHYAEEIGGHFNPKVYEFATHALPLMFNWLLNAASVRRFMPWGQTQSLAPHLKILGEVEKLQRLSKKGTVLLVPTHQSNIDSMLVGYVIHLMRLPPFSYGAGLNLFTNPVFSFLMGNLGAYTVDRQKGSALYKATLKNYSTQILKQGVHSIFFPGGGRARSGAIESKLKLGLLGTGLQAQIENLRDDKPNSNIYIVPMVMSYHFVLEASSLIDDYLAHVGKHRFYGNDSDDPWPLLKTIRFFWRFFQDRGAFYVRIGQPMDVFGNLVDENGVGIGPNGTSVDPRKWLTTRGELKPVFQRDREYTERLGGKIVERFHKDNTVLTSALVSFAFFMALRKKYPEMDLYRFLRLTSAQRSLPYDKFLSEAQYWYDRVRRLADQGELFLSEELRNLPLEEWVKDGIRRLGAIHDASALKIEDGVAFTEDMSLLYYYRNRLTGYRLTQHESGEKEGFPGEYDDKGFLV